MHVMAEVIGDVVEFLATVLKRTVGWLLRVAFEVLIETIFETWFRLFENLHTKLLAWLRTRWLSVPLTLLAMAASIGVPFALLVAALRLL